MSLDIEQVEKIAWLARLQIEAEAKADYARNLSDILDFVEQLSRIDTTGVTPMAHPQDLPQRLRADEVTESDQRELFQQVAPAVENGLYLVPKVIE